jgi:DNA-binding LacI/PurR family transcriptional regulator
MEKITTQEIARLAGVSPSAVSIALNGKPGISEKTRARILSVVKQTVPASRAGRLNSASEISRSVSTNSAQDGSSNRAHTAGWRPARAFL